MKIYVNSNNEIKDVNSTTNAYLTEIEVTDGTFDNMSEAKICCYKVEVENGQVRMMTLYVSDKIVDVIDRVSNKVEKSIANNDYLAMVMEVDL